MDLGAGPRPRLRGVDGRRRSARPAAGARRLVVPIRLLGAPALVADPGVTAVVAANDRMALGLLLRLHETGRRIPEDISVVGFDDIAEAEFFHPPLTTIRQDFEGMGRAAVLSLIAMVEESAPTETVEYPAPRLVVRASTAPSA
ncbi:substrate-binding domain-containing protein [Rathayibacter sp. VKM Ac-2630]|uniref:substrate-binding domain-containing protein n=1 Tax=Rathayibacter sp. VKM Ac-2630 TaxID=1938617 RepID=UPI0022A934D9|nr:substrate-binding domain-containing protein [Rathayibacter sp. VKM Ac-2630]